MSPGENGITHMKIKIKILRLFPCNLRCFFTPNPDFLFFFIFSNKRFPFVISCNNAREFFRIGISKEENNLILNEKLLKENH